MLLDPAMPEATKSSPQTSQLHEPRNLRFLLLITQRVLMNTDWKQSREENTECLPSSAPEFACHLHHVLAAPGTPNDYTNTLSPWLLG